MSEERVPPQTEPSTSEQVASTSEQRAKNTRGSSDFHSWEELCEGPTRKVAKTGKEDAAVPKGAGPAPRDNREPSVYQSFGGENAPVTLPGISFTGILFTGLSLPMASFSFPSLAFTSFFSLPDPHHERTGNPSHYRVLRGHHRASVYTSSPISVGTPFATDSTRRYGRRSTQRLSRADATDHKGRLGVHGTAA